jgi:hypothetical protein
MLLTPLGVDRSYKGFFHLNDLYPRRFTCAAGVFTEIPAFVAEANTKGSGAEVNSTWETALYEESFIFDPSVYTQLIPQPVTNPAPGYNFNAVNYMGDIEVLNIQDRKCNPRKQILFHDAILAAASMPIHPERGVSFVHLRCDPECNAQAVCPGS